MPVSESVASVARAVRLATVGAGYAVGKVRGDAGWREARPVLRLWQRNVALASGGGKF